VGELSQRKRVDLLLPIVAQLSEKRTDFILRVVGTGPEEVKLRGMAEQLGVSNRVSFEGFKQKPEVAKMLANADCFVFPTGFDIWGLVLVEAMAAGLPCISSLHAGVTHDLIQDGVTGFGVDFSQTGKVAEILGWVLEHPEESRAMGERARQFIADQVNLQKSAMGFVEAIRIALGRPQELNAETRRRANEALDMASCIRKERLLETNVDGYPKYRFGCPL
jgi:glycosyltransferase involved in cell wall biosynthesis